MVKNLPANTGDISLIPGLARFLGEDMATCSSILVWEIEPGGLQSMGSQRLRDAACTLIIFIFRTKVKSNL